jgi:hypothetical protein
MSARFEWESEVTVMLGHAIAIPGHAELWTDHASWGGTVTFQSFAAVRAPEALELDIPRYSRHMVDVLRSSTNGQNGAATTLRFKGRGTLPAPSDNNAEPPLAVAG